MSSPIRFRPFVWSWNEKGRVFDVERKRVRKGSEETIYTHVHVQDRYPLELTVYPTNMAHYVFKSSVTGKAIDRLSIAELEQFLATEYPDLVLDDAVAALEDQVDRFQVYHSLMLPA